MKTESIEVIIDFLEKQNIKTFYKPCDPGVFNRTIEFQIESSTYYIEWWVNQCYLKLKNEFSSPNIPFKYIAVNEFSPNTIHKYQLCFFDISNNGDTPFGSFKIPFNKAL
jgi:hypothetical protein